MKLAELRNDAEQATKELGKFIIGEEQLLLYVILCSLSSGLNMIPHMLIIGKPGTAKTTLIKHLGTVLGLSTKRVNGTGELMPSDILGYENLRTGKFEEGPIFTNLFHIDEINRLHPKTRSSLLDALQEGSVTIGGTTYELPKPFIAYGSQNPESFGISSPLFLQESDRFALSVFTDWPEYEDHVKINRLIMSPPESVPDLQPVFDAEKILRGRALIARSIGISDAANRYAVTMARQLYPRESDVEVVRGGQYETSIVDEAGIMRGSLHLTSVARTLAAFRGDTALFPEHIDEVALNVLSHRIVYKDFRERKHEEIRDLIHRVVEATRNRARRGRLWNDPITSRPA